MPESLDNQVEAILPDVYRVYPTKVTPSKYISFFVQRRGGNLLFPCVSAHGSIKGSFDALDDMGGVSLQAVGDMHFAAQYNDEIAARYDIPLRCSDGEYPDIKRKVERVEAFRFERHELVPGVTVIPTPGHRPHAVSFLVTLRKKRYLFAGDSLYHDGERWRVFTNKKQRKTMLATLDMLMGEPFDVLLANTSVANPVCSETLDDDSPVALLAEIRDAV